MQFSLLDTSSIDSECLEESDFETECDTRSVMPSAYRIQNRVDAIKQAGGLVAPIICWQSGFDQEEQAFTYEAFEEESNLLNTLAMIKLYREDSRRWHLTNAWVVDNIDQAEVLAQQYLLICGIE